MVDAGVVDFPAEFPRQLPAGNPRGRFIDKPCTPKFWMNSLIFRKFCSVSLSKYLVRTISKCQDVNPMAEAC
jgi:hypothetical protein